MLFLKARESFFKILPIKIWTKFRYETEVFFKRLVLYLTATNHIVLIYIIFAKFKRKFRKNIRILIF